MTPEQKLWWSVVLRACDDATNPRPMGENGMLEGRRAKAWISGGGEDFMLVCDLAGADPDFVRGAFIAGRLTHEGLNPNDKREHV